jgi:hypothetical protein
MKKIIIALALIGMSCYGAEAQTTGSVAKTPCKCPSSAKKAGHRTSGSTVKSGDTYQVCKEKGGYYQCCTHHKSVAKVAVK